MISLIAFPLIPYIYRIVWGAMIVAQWISRGNEVMEIVFYDIVTFFEIVDPDNDNYEGHLTSFFF